MVRRDVGGKGGLLEDEFLEAGDELLFGDLAVLVLVHLPVQFAPNAVTRRLRRAMRNSKGLCQMTRHSKGSVKGTQKGLKGSAHANLASDGPGRGRRARCGGRRAAAERRRAAAVSKAHLARRPWAEVILCQDAIFRLIKMVEDLLDLLQVLGVDAELIR